VLEYGEVFDSSLLKETYNSLIAAGKRYFVIDLAPLDYIYSDSINVLMAFNKRLTDLNGCLAIMNPMDDVVKVLQRAGIYDSLRLFTTEQEILKSSEEYMIQTQQYNQSLFNQQSQPASEFDQLRSEIGSVFGGQESGGSDYNQTYQSQPPQPAQPPQSATFDQEYERAFSNLEGTGDIQQNTRPMGQPNNQGRPAYQQPQPQSRQFTPPPAPVSPSMRQSVPPPPIQPPRPVDKPAASQPPRAFGETRGNPQDFASETQRFSTTQINPIQSGRPSSPDFDEELNDYVPKKSGKSSAEFSKPISFDGEDDLLDSQIKKKSPILVFALVAIIAVIAVGAAGYFVFTSMQPPKDVAIAPTPVPSQPTATPAEPVKPADIQPEPQQPIKEAAVEPPAPTPPVEPVRKTPKPTQRPVQKPKKVVAQPAVKERPVPVVKETEPVQTSDQPAATPLQKPIPTNNKVFISSTPSGAMVEINGQAIGKTPAVWDKPSFGILTIEVSRPGFKTASRDVEYQGGVNREMFTLEKDVEPTPPKPEPVVTPEPVAQPSKPIYDEPETKPSTSIATPPESTPAVSSDGDASIFIASIPPVADVYLNGKLVGRTNVSELKLPSGTITLRFVKGSKEVTQDVTLQSGKNPSKLIRLP
jgi:anti-anti-sigma regulatory factor/outer membrane biosynthesis protein TonB